jgi:hypothetical protein
MIYFKKITELLCVTDEFDKNFQKATKSFAIENKPKKRPKGPLRKRLLLTTYHTTVLPK